MLIVFISALIFGFVHPGSKLILNQGIPLSYFCLFYIGIRLTAQLPFLFKKNEASIKGKRVFYSLIAIGLVGAFLQFFEFKGVGDGLSPAMVTFLMFSYPIWILIANMIGKKQSIGVLEIVQSTSVVLGIFLIGKNEITNLKLNSWTFLYPLIASVLIATWIILSHRLRKEGVGTFQLSAYYDLFSLLALLIIFSGSWEQDWAQVQMWSQNTQYIYRMLLFSILVGLLPNFLFYFGSRQVTSHFAGTILALEPIFSSLYSTWLWPMPLGSYFVIGASFILLANLPKEFLVFAVQKIAYEKFGIKEV